ncbi:hypothetical protein F8M41_023176 [Gigaspora margarita]|uniref:Uncharacterized protein n=1 Tax=Gigaspora margarita TaxID=4874 RepID=A0A8H4ADU4_GIGMA|nr:hypothetical protein F8M41_023176 [Gigaspora margarita]
MHSTHSAKFDNLCVPDNLTFIEQPPINPLLSSPITSHTVSSIHESQNFNHSNNEMEINNGIMNVESSCEPISGYGGENDESYDDYDVSCETTDTDFAKFVNEFSQFEARGLDIIPNIRKTYYYNSLNACAIPHGDNCTDPSLQKIDSVIHSWLVEKLLPSGGNITGENIPILDDSPRASADDIMTQLKENLSAFHGLSKVLISVRAGHIYLLHMIGDEIIMPPNEKNFFQQFPLFVDVAIKIQKVPHMARRNSCQVLVAVEHMKFKGENRSCASHASPDNNHCQRFLSFNTRMINTPSVEGQVFCLLDKVL